MRCRRQFEWQLYTTTKRKIMIIQEPPSELFCKKTCSQKFPGKHLCQSLFFNKIADLRLATLLKKSFWHSRFPVNFAKFLRTPFLQNNSGRLLLIICSIYEEHFDSEIKGGCVVSKCLLKRKQIFWFDVSAQKKYLKSVRLKPIFIQQVSFVAFPS